MSCRSASKVMNFPFQNLWCLMWLFSLVPESVIDFFKSSVNLFYLSEAPVLSTPVAIDPFGTNPTGDRVHPFPESTMSK